MLDINAPIGVMDTGVGGLTVARELQRQFPHEDLVYLGDSKNQPYGNRCEEEILDLTYQLIDFLQQKGIKALAVGCNTISTLIERYRNRYPFEIFSVVEAGCQSVVDQGLTRVGVLSTQFTASTECYTRLIAQKSPHTVVHERGCVDLGGLIEHHFDDQDRIAQNVRFEMQQLLSMGPIDGLVLGCTHYPHVREMIERMVPGLVIIDPAREQARQLGAYLRRQSAENPRAERGRFVVYTSADCEKYREMARAANMWEPDGVNLIKAPIPFAPYQ